MRAGSVTPMIASTDAASVARAPRRGIPRSTSVATRSARNCRPRDNRFCVVAALSPR